MRNKLDWTFQFRGWNVVSKKNSFKKMNAIIAAVESKELTSVWFYDEKKKPIEKIIIKEFFRDEISKLLMKAIKTIVTENEDIHFVKLYKS